MNLSLSDRAHSPVELGIILISELLLNAPFQDGEIEWELYSFWILQVVSFSSFTSNSIYVKKYYSITFSMYNNYCSF